MADGAQSHDVVDPGDLVGIGDPLMVCSFGRSGTHLLIDLVRRQFAAFAGWKWPGESPASLYLPLEDMGPATYPARRIRRTIAHSRRTLIKSHHRSRSLAELRQVQPVLAAWIEARAQSLVIVRDPVIAISKVWALHQHWARRNGLSPPRPWHDFLGDEAQRWVGQVNAAAAIPRAEIVRIEDLIARPRDEIVRIGRFLGETPRLVEPLLIPPHRTALDGKLARLNPRPLSTHILLPHVDRRRFNVRWSASSLALLDAVAGTAMDRLGYRRQRPCDGGDAHETCSTVCGECRFSLQPC